MATGSLHNQETIPSLPLTTNMSTYKDNNMKSSRNTSSMRKTWTLRYMPLCLIAIVIFLIASSHIFLLGSIGTTIFEDDPPLTLDSSKNTAQEYKPAKIEKYIMDNLVQLGFDNDVRSETKDIKTCAMWQDPKVAPPIYDDLQSFRSDLSNYYREVNAFEPIPDLMKLIRETNSNEVCKTARIHKEGIPALFPSGQLSLGSSGYMEPLCTPLRHPDHCFREAVMEMTYFIHDFEAMCNKLKPHSRRVLIDMGASLKFHEKEKANPIVWLLDQYKKFGFVFDDMYGFEITPMNATEVYNDLLPDEYMASYHLINAGVSSEEGHKLNPLDSILRKFSEDDFIVVKLDIDTSSVEVPLALQLLNDESLIRLVDQFYFEHHVIMAEMGRWWRSAMEGSVKSSFDLFSALREKGVASHFWI
jgi:hypothetical protein